MQHVYFSKQLGWVKKAQTEESSHFMIPFIQNSRKCKLICSDKKQISSCLGKCGEGKLKSKVQREIPKGNENVWRSWLRSSPWLWQEFHGCIHIHVKTYIVYFNIYSLMCQSYLNKAGFKKNTILILYINPKELLIFSYTKNDLLPLSISIWPQWLWSNKKF